MLTYLSEEKDRLLSFKNGMEKNPALWTEQSVTIAKIDQAILLIDSIDAEVTEADHVKTQKLADARSISNTASKLADQIENLARGYHADDDAKLLEYDIKPRKLRTSKPVPSKIIVPMLEDDIDGVGFIVTTQVDPHADYYEWQKGMGANVADVNTIPEMKMFKTTKKTYFVDDEVPKGVRMFYRVRAANTNGFGPWSQSVSRVQ